MSFNLSSVKETGDDGWVYTHYIADVDHLGKCELRDWPTFMSTLYLEKVFEDFYGVPTDELFIKFSLRIDQAILLSERVLWDLVIDSAANPEELIINYSLAIQHHFSKKIDLPWTSTTEQLGAYALQNYFDRAIRDETFKTLDLSLTDAYMGHLKLCDLDHEVHQHYYIKKIVTSLVYRDPERLEEWIWLRLTNGQYGGLDPDLLIPGLYIDGNFKKIIHRLLEAERYRDEYLRICALVYGSNLEAVSEVMDYVKSEFVKREIAFAPFSSVHTISIDTMTAGNNFASSVTDTWPPFLIDTGFHQFNRRTMRWEANDS